MPDIKITADELNSPVIDEIINLEESLKRSEGEFVDEIKTPFYYNPIFYYGLMSLFGAFLVWAITEPFYSDTDQAIPFISDYLLFGPVAGSVGLFIGLTYGAVNRDLRQAFHCGIIGIGVGLGVTIVTTIVADILFGIIGQIAGAIMDSGVAMRRIEEGKFPFTGMAFFTFMCGRGLAWAIVSMGAGMSLGVALKSKKLMVNGLAGGLVGGLLGGLFFDPVSRFISTSVEEADLSRAIGISSVGLLVGIFIGVFENISKDAWFLMMKGPLTGKQFTLFKSPMRLGSAPKSDIYLFKDPAIAAHHAIIEKSGTRYQLIDNQSDTGTFVNGKRVDRTILKNGDVITMGETVLKYHERERR